MPSLPSLEVALVSTTGVLESPASLRAVMRLSTTDLETEFFDLSALVRTITYLPIRTEQGEAGTGRGRREVGAGGSGMVRRY